jgi:hypothetical protein
MTELTESSPAKDPSIRPLLRSLLIELSIYAPLVVIYFLVFLRFANEYLTQLYTQSSVLYAVVATAAIIGQGVMLEILTSWLIRRFGLR